MAINGGFGFYARRPPEAQPRKCKGCTLPLLRIQRKADDTDIFYWWCVRCDRAEKPYSA